jgi:hypothetical protein
MKTTRSAALLFLACALAAPLHASTSLPALGASPAATSVSGLSSGAFMAVQYQVIYSASVVGAGVVAGGPYYCAAGSMINIGSCMGMPMTMPLFPGMMVAAARGFGFYGEIDPVSNLKQRRIYIFSGTKDQVVYPPAVNATVAFFKGIGVSANNLKFVSAVPAGHALLLPAFGNVCDVNATPYISQCKVKGVPYDQPGAILAHIYGKLNPPAASRTGQLVTFKQSEFAKPAAAMADEAFAYVPASCSPGSGCKVHVAFHGCLQSQESVGDDFYGKSSYNDWADSNHIIVLFPQVNKSTMNPNGCWDWTGYTGPAYAFKFGPQIEAVHAMIARLTSAPSAVVAQGQ